MSSYFRVCFLAAHTPDNSFLGFVVEQHLNASDIQHIDDIKRQNQSLVYGKVDNFWKVTSQNTFTMSPTSRVEFQSSNPAPLREIFESIQMRARTAEP